MGHSLDLGMEVQDCGETPGFSPKRHTLLFSLISGADPYEHLAHGLSLTGERCLQRRVEWVFLSKSEWGTS